MSEEVLFVLLINKNWPNQLQNPELVSLGTFSDANSSKELINVNINQLKLTFHVLQRHLVVFKDVKIKVFTHFQVRKQTPASISKLAS